MGKSLRLGIFIIFLLAIIFFVAGFRIRRDGFSTRATPTGLEAFAAKQARHWSIPPAMRELKNPVPDTPQNLEMAKHHWADHCATCHANNGSGDTTIGKNLYPKAPDMRSAGTQSLSDGELYWVIRNGVRLTGMPAWGNADLGTHDDESWMLVSFIRHLPQMAPQEATEMEKMNPKTPDERQEESDEEDFLQGKSPAPAQHQH